MAVPVEFTSPVSAEASWAVWPAVMEADDSVVLRVGAALATMSLWVPVMVPVAVSVAVIDWVPAVLSVTPLVKASVPAAAAVKV